MQANATLLRAVAFSGARLVQTAYEVSQASDTMPAQSVLLLQVSANLLADAESAQLRFYGIPQTFRAPPMSAVASRLPHRLRGGQGSFPDGLRLPRRAPEVPRPRPAPSSPSQMFLPALEGDLYSRLYTRPTRAPGHRPIFWPSGTTSAPSRRRTTAGEAGSRVGRSSAWSRTAGSRSARTTLPSGWGPTDCESGAASRRPGTTAASGWRRSCGA